MTQLRPGNGPHGVDIWNVCLICTGLASTGWKDDADDEAVEGKRFGKDKDEDHAHKQLWLLSICPAEKEQVLGTGDVAV